MPRQEANYEEISRVRNPGTDYVTIILDIWVGDREDPAVGVTRHVAMFEAAQVPGELLVREYYTRYELVREQEESAILWEPIAEIKKKDRDAEQHQHQEERYTQPDRLYGSDKKVGDLYERFLNAIDTLHADPENQLAWAQVDAWRNHHATLHEK